MSDLLRELLTLFIIFVFISPYFIGLFVFLLAEPSDYNRNDWFGKLLRFFLD